MRIGKRKFFYGLYCVLWVAFLSLWLQLNFRELNNVPGILSAAGRLFGLCAALMITVQVFLVSRIPILEKSFGLDKLIRLHSSHGKLGFILVLLHFFFIVASGVFLTELSFVGMTLAIISSHLYFAYALISLILFIVVVGFSYGIVRGRLKYEKWYTLHLLVYLAIGFSFWHQFQFGHTLNSSDILFVLLLILYTSSSFSLLFYRWLLPIFRMRKHKFFVEKIVRETNNTVSLYISGEYMSRFKMRPGQFVIVRFLSAVTGLEAHPFSLSSIDSNSFRLTIKNLGDFTQNIEKVPPGTRVAVEGPYGTFGSEITSHEKILFITGGIGITPVRSLLPTVTQQKIDAILIYGNKTESDIVFKEELNNLSTETLQIFHVLSNQNDYNGETGYVDEEKIRRLVPDLSLREVYLCGPAPMLQQLLRILRELGVDESRIHYEEFSLT